MAFTKEEIKKDLESVGVNFNPKKEICVTKFKYSDDWVNIKTQKVEYRILLEVKFANEERILKAAGYCLSLVFEDVLREYKKLKDEFTFKKICTPNK